VCDAGWGCGHGIEGLMGVKQIVGRIVGMRGLCMILGSESKKQRRENKKQRGESKKQRGENESWTSESKHTSESKQR
jgi:hypothetical protein